MQPLLPSKKVGLHTYYHVQIVEALPPLQHDQIRAAALITETSLGNQFNVIKFSDKSNSLTLLDYPAFFDEAFPVLANYWTVDLETGTYRHRTYADSLNPPILHRKELLLPVDHPQRQTYCILTAFAEQIGLFDDPNRIGFKRAWETLLEQRGYRVAGYDLVPIVSSATVN